MQPSRSADYPIARTEISEGTCRAVFTFDSERDGWEVEVRVVRGARLAAVWLRIGVLGLFVSAVVLALAAQWLDSPWPLLAVPLLLGWFVVPVVFGPRVDTLPDQTAHETERLRDLLDALDGVQVVRSA